MSCVPCPKTAELETIYRRAGAVLEETPSAVSPSAILSALIGELGRYPEEALRFVVDTRWLKEALPRLRDASVERAGAFDPLATFQLLEQDTPYVPVTSGRNLIKVVDRVSVATEIARTVVERQLGRR